MHLTSFEWRRSVSLTYILFNELLCNQAKWISKMNVPSCIFKRIQFSKILMYLLISKIYSQHWHIEKIIKPNQTKKKTQKLWSTSHLPIIPKHRWRRWTISLPACVASSPHVYQCELPPDEWLDGEVGDGLDLVCATESSNDADFLCHIVCAWRRYVHTGQEPPSTPSSLSPCAVCLPVPVVLPPSSVSLTPKHCFSPFCTNVLPGLTEHFFLKQSACYF